MNKTKSKEYIKLKRTKEKGYLTGPNITGGKLPIIFKGVSKNGSRFYFVQDANVVKFINKNTKICYSYIGKINSKSKINISNNNIKTHPRNYFKLSKYNRANRLPTPSGNYKLTPSTLKTPSIRKKNPRNPKIRPSLKNRLKSKSVTPSITPTITPSITPFVYGPSTFTPSKPSIITTPIEKKDYSIYIYSGVALLILLIIIAIYYFFSS